ncbi:MAG: RdgB/HAM1 family non-canonical purine NTP pyrophosphatase [Actinobacteria bacterium]|nr:RdgB/HAM1 family non-canonical purine NTP pyrophosphatase [Actinomycetota bacterium]MBW3642571.1 RdgB/HAM1 family non-canonical purine NTP pyrophosphatase [Actinomycetota bacterium]
MRLVLATANLGKAAEVAAVLGAAPDLGGLVLVPRPPSLPEPEEDGDSLLANARIKAEAVVEATGEAAVADDTGLEVAALHGRPGLFTARFAGPGATFADNIARLLAELEGVEDRRARWRTAALVAFPDGTQVEAEGTCDGTITRAPRGTAGFGYDPVFVPDDGDGRTLAELTREEKNALSHRGRAFRALAERLAGLPWSSD